MAGVDVTGNQDCLSSLGEQDSVLLTSLLAPMTYAFPETLCDLQNVPKQPIPRRSDVLVRPKSPCAGGSARAFRCVGRRKLAISRICRGERRFDRHQGEDNWL
jgi:hypothetical protein